MGCRGELAPALIPQPTRPVVNGPQVASAPNWQLSPSRIGSETSHPGEPDPRPRAGLSVLCCHKNHLSRGLQQPGPSHEGVPGSSIPRWFIRLTYRPPVSEPGWQGVDAPVGDGWASSSPASAAYLPATRREVGPRHSRGRLGSDSPLGVRVGGGVRSGGRRAYILTRHKARPFFRSRTRGAVLSHKPPIPRATATRLKPRGRPWVLYTTLVHTPCLPASSLRARVKVSEPG